MRRRCDIEPMGWSVQFGGPAGTQPSEWKCVNMSVNPAPDYCQWSNFWVSDRLIKRADPLLVVLCAVLGSPFPQSGRFGSNSDRSAMPQDIPSNATYAGTDKVNGVLADKWVYWSGGDEFAFWGTATSPLKTAKTDAAVPGQVEWAIDFVDFVPGPPVLEKFQPTAGVQCPPAGRRGPSGRPSVTRKGRILGVVNN